MISFTEIPLKNHIVIMEKDDDKKPKFTIFQRGKTGSPLTGTGKFFYTRNGLDRYLEKHPDEKHLFQQNLYKAR